MYHDQENVGLTRQNKMSHCSCWCYQQRVEFEKAKKAVQLRPQSRMAILPDGLVMARDVGGLLPVAVLTLMKVPVWAQLVKEVPLRAAYKLPPVQVATRA